MIRHEPLYRFFVLECDRCGRQTTVTTARTEQRVREIATRWGWAFETEYNDLCRRCAVVWKSGMAGRISGWKKEAADVQEVESEESLKVSAPGEGRCHRCNAELLYDDLSNSRFCPSCGWDELFRIVCAQCGEDLPLTATVGKDGVYLCQNCAKK